MKAKKSKQLKWVIGMTAGCYGVIMLVLLIGIGWMVYLLALAYSVDGLGKIMTPVEAQVTRANFRRLDAFYIPQYAMHFEGKSFTFWQSRMTCIRMEVDPAVTTWLLEDWEMPPLQPGIMLDDSVTDCALPEQAGWWQPHQAEVFSYTAQGTVNEVLVDSTDPDMDIIYLMIHDG